MNRWILPTGGASAVESLQQRGLPRLVKTQEFKISSFVNS
jgi:hypothetical protein